MILFFQHPSNTVYALETSVAFATTEIEKISWLFGGASFLLESQLDGTYVGPRKEMITPWSTNAVEICANMGLIGIQRIESFNTYSAGDAFDPMLQSTYNGLTQTVYQIDITPEPVKQVEDIGAYNASEGLALNSEEVSYLEQVSLTLGRPLTDSEVFGFSQVNSEHCRQDFQRYIYIRRRRTAYNFVSTHQKDI
jgi:phosphoribosylformylglycinamidine synthase